MLRARPAAYILGPVWMEHSMRCSWFLRAFGWRIVAISACCCSALAQDSSPLRATTPAPNAQAPVHLTAEQDRLRLLELLGLKEADLRPAPVPDAKSPHAANYDEAKANVYPKLPDP